MKHIKYTNKELYVMELTGSEQNKYYENKPLTKKKDGKQNMQGVDIILTVMNMVVANGNLITKEKYETNKKRQKEV